MDDSTDRVAVPVLPDPGAERSVELAPDLESLSQRVGPTMRRKKSKR
ncbi:MAG: hypothetical protein Q8L48_27800 [Archangium sp.]|nr:hypothetical protein [Archangium sp.]